MRLRKGLLAWSSACLVFLLAYGPIQAYNVSPGSGNLTTGTHTFTITAAPPDANQTGVNVHILSSNMTITGYTAPAGGNWIGPAGCAAGNTTYDANTLCFGFAKSSGTITAGESLGTFTAVIGSVTTASLTHGANAEYNDGTTSSPVTGSVANYTITSLPDTGLFDGEAMPYFVMMIFCLLLLMAVTYNSLKVYSPWLLAVENKLFGTHQVTTTAPFEQNVISKLVDK
jgi:hypothetical protein